MLRGLPDLPRALYVVVLTDGDPAQRRPYPTRPSAAAASAAAASAAAASYCAASYCAASTGSHCTASAAPCCTASATPRGATTATPRCATAATSMSNFIDELRRSKVFIEGIERRQADVRNFLFVERNFGKRCVAQRRYLRY